MTTSNKPGGIDWNPSDGSFRVPAPPFKVERNAHHLATYGSVRDQHGVTVQVLESSRAGDVRAHLLVRPVLGATTALLSRREAYELAVALLRFAYDPEVTGVFDPPKTGDGRT